MNCSALHLCSFLLHLDYLKVPLLSEQQEAFLLLTLNMLRYITAVFFLVVSFFFFFISYR